MKQIFTHYKTATDGTSPRGGRDGQPLIGLSVNVAEETSRLHEAYIKAVLDAGGVPVLVPASIDREALRRVVDTVDGLILTGGADIAGEYFGERTLEGLAEVDPFREAYDFLLLRLALDRQLPVFGICRGMQVINVALGGTLWQDLPSQYTPPLEAHNVLSPREKPCHTVDVVPGSILERVTGKRVLAVNSRHHQAVKDPAPGLRVVATSQDGVMEAIEAYPERRIIGVQWHPENMAGEAGDEDMKRLLRFFVSEAALFARAKNIHGKYLTVDSHCDTPMLFGRHSVDLGRRDAVALVDLAKMAEGRMDAAFMAAYIPQGPRDDKGLREARAEAVALLEEVRRQVAANSGYAGMAVTFDDAIRLKGEGKRAVFLALENGYALGRDIANAALFRDMGVVYITLCHNGANDICDSARGESEHGGLSEFGKEVVKEMNRCGVVIDLSHAAETTFYEVLALSTRPVICSHSSVRALCDHPRNLTDDQIRALAGVGGVVQICLYGGFLALEREATVRDAADHIDHIVRLVGVNHAGIGSDFDGDGGVAGCNGENEIINLTVELLRRGYTDGELGKILGGNLRRVVEEVQRGVR